MNRFAASVTRVLLTASVLLPLSAARADEKKPEAPTEPP